MSFYRSVTRLNGAANVFLQENFKNAWFLNAISKFGFERYATLARAFRTRRVDHGQDGGKALAAEATEKFFLRRVVRNELTTVCVKKATVLRVAATRRRHAAFLSAKHTDVVKCHGTLLKNGLELASSIRRFKEKALAV